MLRLTWINSAKVPFDWSILPAYAGEVFYKLSIVDVFRRCQLRGLPLGIPLCVDRDKVS